MVRPDHEDAVGKLGELGDEGALPPVGGQAIVVKGAIDSLDRSVRTEAKEDPG